MINNPVIGGKKLPALSNPAGAANIQTGYEAIDGNGNKITGTHVEETGIDPTKITTKLYNYLSEDVALRYYSVPNGKYISATAAAGNSNSSLNDLSSRDYKITVGTYRIIVDFAEYPTLSITLENV